MSLYVTFHGGKPTKDIPQPIPYVVSYDQTPHGKWELSNGNVLNLPKPSHHDNELRDIQLASDGHFYLVNGDKNESVIWRIPRGGVPHGQPPAIFTSPNVVCSIDHPFALAFDSAMSACYASNQDTNVVVRVFGSGNQAGEAEPINSSIPGSNFLPGTFVASQRGFSSPHCDGPTSTDVSSKDGGLGFKFGKDNKLSNSVRGVAIIGTILYVADEVDHRVRLYDTVSGDYLGEIQDADLLKDPVHLLAADTMLYMTSSAHGGSVLSFDTASGTIASKTRPKAVVTGVKTPSGLTFDGDGNLYVASREGRQIDRYDYDSSSHSFTPARDNPIIGKHHMTDDPEFILWVV
jgi:hypothetical protein